MRALCGIVPAGDGEIAHDASFRARAAGGERGSVVCDGALGDRRNTLAPRAERGKPVADRRPQAHRRNCTVRFADDAGGGASHQDRLIQYVDDDGADRSRERVAQKSLRPTGGGDRDRGNSICVVVIDGVIDDGHETVFGLTLGRCNGRAGKGDSRDETVIALRDDERPQMPVPPKLKPDDAGLVCVGSSGDAPQSRGVVEVDRGKRRRGRDVDGPSGRKWRRFRLCRRFGSKRRKRRRFLDGEVFPDAAMDLRKSNLRACPLARGGKDAKKDPDQDPPHASILHETRLHGQQ